jgi:hypothetical protein
MYALDRSQNSIAAERMFCSTKESGHNGTYGKTSFTKEEYAAMVTYLVAVP